MTATGERPATLGRRILRWLPDRADDRRVRIAAWLLVASNILIVGTGGLVRLTDSGLGCPTWPRCTAESFVATPEMGIHGAIEFGNRLLTFVLIVVAIVAFLFVLRMRKQRRDLFVLSLLVGLGIPMQGVVGGLTVLSQLNPYVVGLHFVVSVVLVVLATTFVYRVHRGPRGAALIVPRWYAALGWIAAMLTAITVVVGIITTGSGPHAGDRGAVRNGLDSEFLQHVHSWPAYALLAVTTVLVVAAFARGYRQPRPFVFGLLATEFVQIGVGVAQARLGLPPFLVGAHMVLSCVLVALMAAALLSFRASSPTSRAA